MIVDDHPLVREGLRHVFACANGFRIVAEASSGEEALREASHSNLDVALIDVRLPGIDGFATSRRLRLTRPELEVVIVTQLRRVESQNAARDAGAIAFVTKSSHHTILMEAVAAAAHGISFFDKQLAGSDALSKREVEVVAGLIDGASGVEVANALNISYYTLIDHISSIKRKLGVPTRNAAIAEAARHGIA